MTDAELTEYLMPRPKFLEKGPDIQTKLQQSMNLTESIAQRRPSLPKQTYSEMVEYFCPLDQLEQLIKTDFNNGLSQQDAQDRHLDKGPNVLDQESDWKIFLREINLFTVVLMIAAIICGTLSVYMYITTQQFLRTDFMTFCLLVFVILLTVLMGFQQRKKSQSKLKNDYGTIATVVRNNGTLTQIEVGKLVPGDVYEIIEGTLIPADLRVLESRDLQVQINEDTNNTVQASKGSQIFCGSLIRSGAGRGVVIKIGQNTTLAQIKTKKRPRLLQIQLKWFQNIVSALTLLVILIVLIWAGLYWNIRAEEGFKTVVQIIIAMIPEALLVVVTISFQMATRRMAKMNLLIKSQEAIEKLSEVNCLCIGLNEVVTSRKHVFHGLYDGEQMLYKVKECAQLARCGMMTCNLNALDGTEKALMKFFKQFDDPNLHDLQYYVSSKGVQFNIAFNSCKKYSLSVVVDGPKYFVYIKGAPEIIWSYCKYTNKGDISTLSSQEFYANLHSQCRKGLRGIGFAQLVLNNADDLRINDYGYDFAMENFTYLGTIYLSMTIPTESKDLIAQIKDQGIKVVVVTGEHAETASYICRQSGLFKQPHMIEGSQLYLHVEDQDDVTRLSNVENKLTQWCQKDEIIFARTNPEQTSSIVRTLQQLNYVVAVTGEALTDLSSFRQADVSVSKKFGSQQMCIQSSDLVLTSDQSFLNLYKAIVESKRAVNNVLKAIMFCLASNTAMIAALFCYIALGTPLPLSQNLMLATSITVDLMVGISLAREEFEPETTKRLNLLLYSCLAIGIMEAAGGLISSLSALMYFGFDLQSVMFTRFQQGYPAQGVYDPSSITLNNTYLAHNCEAISPQINFQWSSYDYEQYDQRMVFVSCGECTHEQQIGNPLYTGLCWNSLNTYRNCHVADNLDKYCYTSQAGYFAQNSFYAFIIVAQCINYFGMRTQVLSFAYPKLNLLAVYGIIISMLSIPVITYTPGIKYVFESAPMPWDLLGSVGLPFCMVMLVISEANKLFLRRRTK